MIQTPVEISGEILKHAKFQLKKYAKEIEELLLLSAYFDDTQQQATKDAASMASKSVALGVGRLPQHLLTALRQKTGFFMVYDLGGGTFDVNFKFRKGVFSVVATGGDTNLGDDFDEA